MSSRSFEIDPRFDLVIERSVDVPPHLLWRAWTEPEHLKAWFTPAPWTTARCEIDLRPGGRFSTVMRSPEGEEMEGASCYLEIVENRRLVWTTGLLPGFRPVAPGSDDDPHGLIFTAVIRFEPDGEGTRYSAHVMHSTEEQCSRHAEMGFKDGWGTAADQLVAYARGL